MRDEGQGKEERQEALRMLDDLDGDGELPKELREAIAEILSFVYAAERAEEDRNAVHGGDG